MFKNITLQSWGPWSSCTEEVVALTLELGLYSHPNILTIVFLF